MIGINSNINSLVAQQNLGSTQSALSSAITRLSSGKRINSAADDAAGQAIASRMTSQINGLNQGVSNANDGVSMTQTASSGLSQITDNLQRIRQLAVQASSGSLSSTDQAALQSEVSQRISEINRISSQTTYNGTNLLDGSAGVKSFQVGANVGQSISVDLGASANVSALQLGGGVPQKGTAVGSIDGLSLDATGKYVAATATSPAAITTVNVIADGKGGYTYTDQNNKDLGDGTATAPNTFLASNVITTTAGKSTLAATALSPAVVGPPAVAAGTATAQQTSELASFDANAAPPQVSAIDISTTNGASSAIESIDNALNTVNALQSQLGAVQNRFSSVATTQQAQSTDLSSAQSQITDADFAQETANLSKAQVLQQAGISVLAQANSLPQQVLKLLG
ncbi:MAG: flagellin [Pseudomonadota bacterium]|jgi:flagellin|uniref:Flagellin n=1 Tax=Caballeronia sordidicola TaxID=196367 RepID=A0A242M3N2_CABSO|nr:MULTISPECIES: flagellin [Burkholderiaceae]AMM12751.1 flagellin [Burkholderia sp. PAMC 28687]MDP9156422.1 flagellin [Pseudomonadota bacterium]OTP65762.1 Flagellar biosynthesis protein FliC [Caballeronia sordidicola]